MACEEMQLYYAYLDAIEEEKRKAQPWECQVTVIAQDDEAPAQPASKGAAKPVMAKASGFACDNPE
jgi:hypothetical protein